MRTVVAAVIERSDRRLLIAQRRRNDTSALKWEFPGGKVEPGETPEAALARELLEELGITLSKCAPIGRVVHKYAETPEELEILFFAAAIAVGELTPRTFEKVTRRKKRKTRQLSLSQNLLTRARFAKVDTPRGRVSGTESLISVFLLDHIRMLLPPLGKIE